MKTGKHEKKKGKYYNICNHLKIRHFKHACSALICITSNFIEKMRSFSNVKRGRFQVLLDYYVKVNLKMKHELEAKVIRWSRS